jgi:hypothetical protein
VAPGSIQECSGELLFLGDNGVYSLRGSSLRSVSKDKIHYYIKKLDPARLHKAVASNIELDGIYRLNVSPFSTYATTVDSGKNSWYLDYHYERSRNHVPFYEPIWSYGEREVSCYGEYVAGDTYRKFIVKDLDGIEAYLLGQLLQTYPPELRQEITRSRWQDPCSRKVMG